MAKQGGKKKSNKKRNERLRLLLAVALVLVLVLAVEGAMGDPLAIFGIATSPAPTQPAVTQPAATEGNTPAPTATPPTTPEGTLDVYVLDVGQGDSIFLRSPGGKTMLVDASTGGMYPRIDAFLQQQGVSRLDVVIGTHPHADHIGGMQDVVENYEIGVYYMPDVVATTRTFENLLDALDERNVPVEQAVAGENSFIEWDKAVEVRILSPIPGVDYKDDMNAWSVVCRVQFGESAILLAGDAEEESEVRALQELPASCFAAQVLKLGHHGSSTSTSEELLAAVKPEVAIASLGEDNTYGHPHTELLERLEEHGIPLYRTDLDGTMQIVLDGKAWTIEPIKAATATQP